MPKKSDVPSEKVKIKWVFGWYQKSIGLYYWHNIQISEIKNVVAEANTSPISEKKNTDTIDKTDKSQPSKTVVPTSNPPPTHLTQ